MMRESMELSKHMVHVMQVEESRKRKQTREGKRSKKAEEYFQGIAVLKSGISLGFKRDSPTKGSKFQPRVTMIGNTSLDLREKMK